MGGGNIDKGFIGGGNIDVMGGMCVLYSHMTKLWSQRIHMYCEWPICGGWQCQYKILCVCCVSRY